MQIGPDDRWPDRRTVLRWLAAGVGVGALAGCSSTAASGPEATPEPPMTVQRWRAVRGEPFLVAHRGAGDVVPEHTIEAYTAALGWGAKALEVSVCQTSDGVLVCNHDLTLDRTTNLTGRVSARTIAEVNDGRVEVPWLGPKWQGDGRPHIAHLDDALDVIGTRAVVCLEAKDDKAFFALMEVVKKRNLKSQIYVKAHASSRRIEQAHAAGFPVFGYLGSSAETTPKAIDALAARLNSPGDFMVLPAFVDGAGMLPDALLRRAVATGVEVAAFPLHRRSDIEHFRALGVQGAVVASYGYLADTATPDPTPWPGNALSPGTITRSPGSASYGLGWPEAGVAALNLQGKQHFVLLGGAVVAGAQPSRLTLGLEMRLDQPIDTSVPRAPVVAVSLGHPDDRYVDFSGTTTPGHQVVVSADGGTAVMQRLTEGSVTVASAPGPELKVGSWVALQLTVDGGHLTVSRADSSATVSADGVELGGGYLHLGRVPTFGSVSLRKVSITLS